MVESPVLLITVCVCTFHRPVLLERLLSSLAAQCTGGDFEYEIVVVDNDRLGTAQAVVDKVTQRHRDLVIRYYVEPIQGISYARNAGVGLAGGNYIAFIDDDEYAEPEWLAELFRASCLYAADAVFGPVLPILVQCPTPRLVSNLFERPRFISGTRLQGKDGRTGNALVRGSWLRARKPEPFALRFAESGGEDSDFFMWMGQRGAAFVWCDTALVYEEVPLQRQRFKWLYARRLRASAIYWREANKNRTRAKSFITGLVGIFGGSGYLLAAALALPLGLHHARCLAIKSTGGFGRTAALFNFKWVGYKS